MSKVLITASTGEFITVEAKFSFDASYDFSTKVLEISGALSCDGPYLANVDKIESDRYIVEGIRINAESYGSETGEIIYHFTAKSYEIK